MVDSETSSFMTDVAPGKNATSTETLEIVPLPAHFKLVKGMYTICIPIFMLFGGAGNVISFILMCKKALRNLSISVYLRVLAIYDTWYLWHCGIIYIALYGSDFSLDISTLVECSDYFALFMSVQCCGWVTVAMSVDRFIALYFPFKSSTICTPRNATKVVVAITIVQILINFRKFFTWRPLVIMYGNRYCSPIPSARVSEFYIWPWFETTSISILPVAIMSVLNIIIIVKLYRISGQASGSQSAVSKTNVKTSVTLLSVTFTFIILNLPMGVYWTYWSTVGDLYGFDDILKAVLTLLSLLNNSINFLLYCCSSKMFREHLRQLFGRPPQVAPLAHINMRHTV